MASHFPRLTDNLRHLSTEESKQLFLSLPRPALFHYFALAKLLLSSGAVHEGRQEIVARAREELGAFLSCLANDLRTAGLVKAWKAELSGDEPSLAAQVWREIQQLSQTGDWSDSGVVFLYVDALCIHLVNSLAVDRRLKETNPKTIKSTETALYCIQRLLSKTEQLSPEERTQFRLAEREAFCRQMAVDEGREDLLPYMTGSLFQERIIPEVTRQLKAVGLYVRPRRPKKIHQSP